MSARFEHYQVLGQIEELTDRILTRLITEPDTDILLARMYRLETLLRELRRIFDEQRQATLEGQLEASLELVGQSPERMRQKSLGGNK